MPIESAPPTRPVIRAIRAQDRDLWLELLRSISWATRYKRGARAVEDLQPEDIDRAVNPDANTEVALVAMMEDRPGEVTAGVAGGTEHERRCWEFTLVVLDAFQRRGIGRALMDALVAELRSRGAVSVEGDVLATNRDMLKFVRRLGFDVEPGAEEMVRRVRLQIRPDAPSAQ